MLIEQLDKYIKQIDIVDRVNSVCKMSIDELIIYISESDDKQGILKMLDKDKREQIEKLIDGGIL